VTVTVPEPGERLDILFVMRHAGFVRNYQSAIRRLMERGHRVHVGYQVFRRKHGETVLAERLSAEFDGFTYDLAPKRVLDEWGATASLLRIVLDYLRYLDSRYRRATALRERIENLVPTGIRWAGWCAQQFGDWGVRALARVIAAAERQVPFSPVTRVFMESRAFSMLLVTPLVDVGSDQVDYVREAARLGVPSALCVASWDNLTNKGLMRAMPDRVLLWNEGQKREAVELHGVRPEQVVITGAQLFDEWFTWTPGSTKRDFAGRLGLRGDRPIILYLGSSFFIAPKEAEFATRWVEELRRSDDPLVAGADILIRPHPNNRVQWLGSPLAAMDGVVLWPPVDADPFSPEFKDDFFDSMWHAGVAVAVNTSAEIEAAILGRTICALRAPEFVHSQEGTLHFDHLSGDTGVVLTSTDFRGHVDHLGQALRYPERFAARTRAFVERFVRPRGMEVPATEWLVEAIEELVHVPTSAPSTREQVSLTARILRPFALIVLWMHPENKDPLWLLLLRPGYRAAIATILFLARHGVLPRVGPWVPKTAARRQRRAGITPRARIARFVATRTRRLDRIRRDSTKSAARVVRQAGRRTRSAWYAARWTVARWRGLAK
jgi:hypothetical protein